MTHYAGRGRKGRLLATAAGALSVAAVIGGVGLASASASPAAAARSGTEHFSLMTTKPSGSRSVIIASGLFTAGGVDINGNTTDLVRLPGGTFKIHHGGAVHVLKQQFNPATCLANFKATAKFTVGGGTGKYKGITGSGMAVISLLFIARRTKGHCNPNGTPVVNEQTITATGRIRL